MKSSSFSFKKKGPPKVPIPVVGRQPVKELLRRGIRPDILLIIRRGRSGKEDPLLARCRSAGWKAKEVDRSELDRAAEGLNHQGYVALIDEFPYVEIDELIAGALEARDSLVIALDQIQDAGNLGAILRSAECGGVAGALLPAHRSAGVSAAVIRRSAGAALHLPICRPANLSDALDVLKSSGFRIFGADQEGSQVLYNVDLTGRIVLVVGSEDRGLRPGVKRRCDGLLAIPLQGRVESLNASAAAAICIFEAVRQRTQKPKKEGS